MHRRHFTSTLALALGSAAWPAMAQKNRGPAARDAGAWRSIEASVGGRLGVAVLDTRNGRIDGHRPDERFPMCSTFKWILAALVLERVDADKERLDKHVYFSRDALMSHAPITEKRVTDPEGMSMAELCEAAVTVSDNTAANLLLETSGGAPALTRFVRYLGDNATRFDRLEPLLNEAIPGDPRDTTTPHAMATALRSAALGNALSPKGRSQLVAWMAASSTGTHRLRAGFPNGWRVADKTGTGEHGTTNHVAVVWPTGREPLVVAAFLTECEAALPKREAALADVAREVSKRVLQVS